MKLLFTMFVTAVGLTCAGPASAQNYPSKPVHLIGSFAAGGAVDLMARTFNDKLGELLGQPVVVEARPGADGAIGTEYVSRAAPDGYTLLLAGTPHVTLPAMMNVGWHPTRDFVGIGTVAFIPNVVVVPASVPVNTLADFVSYARGRKGQINSLNGGSAGAQNLNTELFKRVAGIEMTSVPYKGLPLGVPDLLSGTLHFAILPPPLVDAHVKSGKLKPLAVSSTRRIKRYPDVPTMAEAGFPQASLIGWYAVLAPAGTPREIVNKLNTDLNRALSDPSVLARIAKLSAERLPPLSPQGVDEMLVKEVDRWQGLVRDAGLKVN